MPLAFPSLSHGWLAFGFFNIETDLLLLENRFFFAPEFCALIADLAGRAGDQDWAGRLPGWVIDRAEEVGDLGRAIQGRGLSGFIGEVYRRFPFPRRPEDFKQQPEGRLNRAWVEALLGRWARPKDLPAAARAGLERFDLDGFVFDRAGLIGLVDYVWRGGLPGWRGEIRPDYVLDLEGRLTGLGSPLRPGLESETGR